MFALLESMQLLAAAAEALGEGCIVDLRICEAKNTAHTQALIPALTALAQQHGYARLSALCTQAGNDPRELRRLLREQFGRESGGNSEVE